MIGGILDSMEILALDPIQANFLAVCNKNFATLSFMYSSGVFDIKGGNALLSFDNMGKLLKIKRELYSIVNNEVVAP